MESRELRALQRPLKERYREDPGSALVTLSASGTLEDGVTCSLETGRAVLRRAADPGVLPRTHGDLPRRLTAPERLSRARPPTRTGA
ncbi:hypothetical protein ACQEU6_29575 [Spirillospora sp. CA-108201]